MKGLLQTAYRAVLRDDRGLVLLVFVLYSHLSARLSAVFGVHRIMSLLSGIMVLAIGLRWLFEGQRPSGWLRPALWMGGYGLVCIASILGAAEPERAWDAIFFLGKSGLIVMILVVLIQSADSLRRVVTAVLVAGIVMGTVTTVQHLAGMFEYPLGGFGDTRYGQIVGELHAFRAAGSIGDPNYYAQAMLVVVPLALYRLWSAKRFWRFVLPSWAFFVSMQSVVLTYSRGGVLAVFVMLALLTVVAFRRRPGRVNLAITGALLIALVPLLPEGYVSRMTGVHQFLPGVTDKAPVDSTADKTMTARDRLMSEPSFRGRLSENIVSYQMFRDHPVLGVGVNNYEVNYQRYSQQLGLDPRTERRSAHNLYLETLAETGLPGGVVFMTMLCVLLYGARRSRLMLVRSGEVDDAELIAAWTIGAIGFFVAAIFLHAMFTYHMWFLLGIGFALPRVAETPT
jgi:O-antigen ligase